jgi:hypothetical protein
MLRKKVSLNEKDFIGYDYDKKIKICSACIKEANKQLRKVKKKGENSEALKVLNYDISYINNNLNALKDGAALSNQVYNHLVDILNKYYYKRRNLWVLLLVPVLILLLSMSLADYLPIVNYPIFSLEEDQEDTAMMQIPGYNTQTVTKKNPYVQLKNVEGNSVYLKYYVYDDENNLLYESSLIAPEKVCDLWNAYDDLKRGTNKIILDIRAYDVKDGSECSNAVSLPMEVVKS